jgi:hypothetical protein
MKDMAGSTIKEGDLHIFRVETDFIAASNKGSAVDYYIEMIGEPERREEIESDVEEIPRDEWTVRKVVDIDESGHPEHTFQELVVNILTFKNQEYPTTIASTEY